MSFDIVFAAHDCEGDDFPLVSEGSVIECDECGSQWMKFSELQENNWSRLNYLDISHREYDYDLRIAVDRE